MSEEDFSDDEGVSETHTKGSGGKNDQRRRGAGDHDGEGTGHGERGRTLIHHLS